MKRRKLTDIGVAVSADGSKWLYRGIPEWHDEYGALYGVSLPEEMLDVMIHKREDEEEVEKLVFYSQVMGKERIAEIDEKLLEYWK